MASTPRVNVLRLFKAPSKWSPAQLTGLNIEERSGIRGATLVEGAPDDGDEGFEAMATEFCRPTKEQLLQHKWSFLDDQFGHCFSQILRALSALERGQPVQSPLDTIANFFTDLTRSWQIWQSYLPISFHLSSLNIRGRLVGVGAYHYIHESFPYAIFIGKKGPAEQPYAMEEIAPYLLIQAIMKYERQPARSSHPTCVIGMKGTMLQVNRAVVYRQYLRDLIDQKVPSDTLTVLRSELYDLLESDGRRECLRVFLGLTQDINGQIEIYKIVESGIQ